MAIITKTYGRILAALLSMLGFTVISSCGTDYGCGTSGFKPQVTGTVVSKEDEFPIEGIRVVLKDEYRGYDTIYTAKNGDFLLQHPTKTEGCENFSIELQDVDGETNGSFEKMEIPIATKNKQNLGTIRMTQKK